MKDIEAFIAVFGDITVLQVVEVILAIGFGFAVWKKLKKYLIDKHEAEKKRDADLKAALTSHETRINEALDGVHKYPEWRQQSIQIQKDIEIRMQAMNETLDRCIERLEKMEDSDNRRTRNQLRDRLLQNYRYYTNKERNPSQSWTQMESEAFWELFRDYEDAGGNGYMHSEVLPAMQRLTIVDVGSRPDI